MEKFIIKNADGSQQYVMPAVHDTRKKAEATLMSYVHNYNKGVDNDEYLSLFDFIIEIEKCIESNKIIQDFEHAKQILGSSEFVLAKESYCFCDVEINYKHMASLIAMNQLFSIAEAWNKLDEFVPDLSNSSQKKWFPWFKYVNNVGRFVYAGASCIPASITAPLSLRVCFKSSERAHQFGLQFIDLFNKVFL